MKTVLFLCALSLPGLAAADPPHAPAPPERALNLLGAVDVFLDAEQIKASGLTEAQATALAADPAQRRYLRVRAVSALKLLGTPQARAALERFAAVSDDFHVRRQAVVSLVRGFGPDDQAGVEAALKTAANADDPLRAVIDGELARLREQAR